MGLQFSDIPWVVRIVRWLLGHVGRVGQFDFVQQMVNVCLGPLLIVLILIDLGRLFLRPVADETTCSCI